MGNSRFGTTDGKYQMENIRWETTDGKHQTKSSVN
jgi:hypothetical protein